VADDFRNRAFASSWVCYRWKPDALSLDCHVGFLPAISRRDWVGTYVSTSLLASAAANGGATAKHLTYHAPRRSHARLVVRRRIVSALVLVRHRLCSYRRLDDLSKGGGARATDSGRLINSDIRVDRSCDRVLRPHSVRELVRAKLFHRTLQNS